MTADATLRALKAALEPLITEEGGTLAVMTNEGDALSYLCTGATGWRVVLLIDEETIPDDEGSQYGGIAGLMIRLFVQHQEGPVFDPGSSVYESDGCHPKNLLMRCEQVRLWMLRLRWERAGEAARDVDHATGLRYMGRQSYVPGPDYLTLRTYKLTFAQRHGLLMPDESDLPIPVTLDA